MSTSDRIIASFQAIARVIWAATALLAPWLVIISPAVFFGWTTYQTALHTLMPVGLAVAVGAAAAVGLETVNIASAHAALQLSHEREQHAGKFILACGLVVFYVVIGIVGMYYLDADLAAKIIGGAMFLLAPVAIIAQALTMDLARVRQDVERERVAVGEAAIWQREMDERRQAAELEQRYSLALERARLNAQVRIERVRTMADRPQPAPVIPETPPTPVIRWADKAAFLADNDKPPDLTASAIVTLAGVSDRTAHRWLATSRNGGSQ